MERIQEVMLSFLLNAKSGYNSLQVERLAGNLLPD
jgi:hypothetical protein